MSIQAARGSPERVFPRAFTLSDADYARAKVVARKRNKSFAEFVRGLVRETLNDDDNNHTNNA